MVVAGLAASGYAAADGLLELGARVIVLDESDTPATRERAAILEVLDATVRIGAGSTATLPDGVDLVVTSPGWPPRAPSWPRLARVACRSGPRSSWPGA